mmetsp:Transcript_35887/g.94322  ORF Transcript_35887/g.94322 Transcript_35887/m.94322 type:complete len:295 (-) Transcript_35887:356-1240(-)
MEEVDESRPSFLCPLTLEVMRDPVTAADGHSYEREDIVNWLQKSHLSPLTGAELAHREVTPNHALRNAIAEGREPRLTKPKVVAPMRARGPPKTIILGDAMVGKTSLVHRVKEGTFKEDGLNPTIGCSFCEHMARLPHGGQLKLAIWDTAGQEKYRSFTRQYFRGVSAAVLVYDITSSASFESLKRWLAELEREAPTSSLAVVIIGSKADRAADARQVPPEGPTALAESIGAIHLETSSKYGTNCLLVFEHVGRMLVERGLVSESGEASGAVLSLRSEAVNQSSRRAAGICNCG